MKVSSRFYRKDKPVIYRDGRLWRVADHSIDIVSAGMGDVKSAWYSYSSMLNYRLWG